MFVADERRGRGRGSVWGGGVVTPPPHDTAWPLLIHSPAPPPPPPSATSAWPAHMARHDGHVEVFISVVALSCGGEGRGWGCRGGWEWSSAPSYWLSLVLITAAHTSPSVLHSFRPSCKLPFFPPLAERMAENVQAVSLSVQTQRWSHEDFELEYGGGVVPQLKITLKV